MRKEAYQKMTKAASHNKGGLHRALGVSEGDKIPENLLTKALHSGSRHVRQMASFASTLRGFKKG
jgi:hypothetical protein